MLMCVCVSVCGVFVCDCARVEELVCKSVCVHSCVRSGRICTPILYNIASAMRHYGDTTHELNSNEQLYLNYIQWTIVNIFLLNQNQNGSGYPETMNNHKKTTFLTFTWIYK